MGRPHRACSSARADHARGAGGRHRPAAEADRPEAEPRLAADSAAALAALARGDDALLAHAGSADRGTQDVKVVGAHEIVPDLLADRRSDDAARPTQADWHGSCRSLRRRPARSARSISGRPPSRSAAGSSRWRASRAPTGCSSASRHLRAPRPARRQEARRAGQMRQARAGTARRPAGHRAATVEAAHAAGLAGIGVEAGPLAGPRLCRACVAQADALGLFVVGLPRRRAHERRARAAEDRDRRRRGIRRPARRRSRAGAAGATGPRCRAGRRGRPPSCRTRGCVRCSMPREIALMGFSAVAARPAAAAAAHRPDGARDRRREAPDCLITIDSPDFTLRVARKVRAPAPASRSSTMSARASGRGGRAGRRR